MTTKPTLVLIHGAWHNPQSWDAVAAILRPQGYEIHQPALLSVGIREEPVTSHLEDSKVLHAEIIVVMHSYGGFAGSDAMKGLVKSRDSTTKGGVIGAIYLAAFITPAGQSLLGAFPSPPPYLKPNENPAYLDPIDPHSVWYQNIPLATAQPWLDALRPQTAATFASSAEYAPWSEIPCTYIMTLKDQGVYPELQESMFAAVQSESKYPWRLDKLESSHSAWLSRPRTVAGIIADVAEGLRG